MHPEFKFKMDKYAKQNKQFICNNLVLKMIQWTLTDRIYEMFLFDLLDTDFRGILNIKPIRIFPKN